MSTWAFDYRVAWIAESVRIFGAINRMHVQRKFRVSIPQASADFAETMRRYPGLMTYDTSAKTYIFSGSVENEAN